METQYPKTVGYFLIIFLLAMFGTKPFLEVIGVGIFAYIFFGAIYSVFK